VLAQPPFQKLQRPGFDRTITREEINRLPIARYTGHVEIVNTVPQLEHTVHLLGRERIIGFDTESKPAFRKGERNPVAIIQCATETAVYIIQLARLPSLKGLEALFANEQIIKAGVDLQQDIMKLRQQVPCSYRGFVDVCRMAKQAGIKTFSMRGLAAVLLGVRISKTMRTSNWARDVLLEQQITYAATDAWISRELYLVLSKITKKLQTNALLNF